MSRDPKVLSSWFGVPRRRSRVPVLGKRELAVLELLWCERQLTALDIMERMPSRDVSLSTVQSTLERLHRKRLVRRRKQVRAFSYEVLITRSEIIRSLLHDITEEIAGGDIAPVVSSFIAYMREEHPRHVPLPTSQDQGDDDGV